ncbi:MAG: hypothetical protein KGD60_12915 [Candidatus Thorarchaeota archaeon]|nr:hypothetical protein [Candidatus Thorarchaeota archaeon]
MEQIRKTNHVVYRSANGQIVDIYYMREPGWRHHNFGLKNSAPPAAGRPTAFVDSVDNSQNLVYRGQDGNIHVLCFIRSEGWKIKNLNAMTGAPVATGDPSCYTYHVFNTQHVIYGSMDGHLHQLYYPHGKEWRHADMTAANGAPPIAGTPTTFVDMVNNSQNIVYRGQDGHIHDFYFIRDQGWTHTNLSQLLGTPLAAGDPFAYTFDLFKTQHVVYRGQDGNLYQLYIPPGKEWRQSNLTVDTSAPSAASDPVCYTYDLK